MRAIYRAFALSAAVGFSASVSAHHGFATEFDRARPVELTGTVTRVEWANPHVRFFLDVRDAQGKPENWAFELGSPNRLERRGWTPTSLRIGELIRIDGVRAKDGARRAGVRTLTLPTGKRLSGAIRALQ